MPQTAEQYFNELRIDNLKYAFANFSQIAFIGLDMSLRSTGYAVVRAGKYIEGGEIETKNYGAPRIHEIASKVIQVIERYPTTMTLIENYAFSKNSSSVTKLAELGGVLRVYLYLRKHRYLPISNTTVKKYLMGNGQAPKNLMAMNVLKKFNIEPIGDDHADAIALAFYLYHAIRFSINMNLPYLQYERESFGTLLNIKLKSKPKKKTNRQLALEVGQA